MAGLVRRGALHCFVSAVTAKSCTVKTAQRRDPLSKTILDSSASHWATLFYTRGMVSLRVNCYMSPFSKCIAAVKQSAWGHGCGNIFID